MEPDAVGTQIQYKIPGMGSGGLNTDIAGPGATSKLLTGLQPATNYQLRFRHHCDTLGTSPWKFKPFVTASSKTLQPDSFNVSIYPNPASGFASLDIINCQENESVNISITDLAGRAAQAHSINVKDRAIFEINTASLKAGVYLVKVASVKKISISRLVISK